MHWFGYFNNDILNENQRGVNRKTEVTKVGYHVGANIDIVD